MSAETNVDILYHHAVEYRFKEFDTHFNEVIKSLPPDERTEAYLMRAQIKLFTTDPSMIDDINAAGQKDVKLKHPLLSHSWRYDAPNHFIVFPVSVGALDAFVQSLPQAQTMLTRYYGEQAACVVRQVQGEIYYFMGRIEKALAVAESISAVKEKSAVDTMLAMILEYRCNLALCRPSRALDIMLDIIRYEKTTPECAQSYEAFRVWVILTTGWSGDAPRFQEDADGEKVPLFEDRMEGIKNGFSIDNALESPFVEHAKRSYEDACTLKLYYMYMFHSMYCCTMKKHGQAESYFLKAYEVAQSTGLMMPIIENGEQTIQLLHYVRENMPSVSAEWLNNITERVIEYERAVSQYRLEDGE